MADFLRFCFYNITLNSEHLRQWFYHHCIQLVKTRRMMYNMTPKSQIKFDLRSRSWPDTNRSCCISFDPYWREKRNDADLKPVSRFYQKLLAKNEWWPLMTSYGHSWPFEGSPRVFLISNLIYDTYSHNTARTEQVCWWLEGLSPTDLRGGRKNDLTLGQFSKIRDIRIVDPNH